MEDQELCGDMDRELLAKVSSLGEIEREITELVVDRLQEGSETYGPWPEVDDRDYLEETLEELIDGMAYLSAELLRLQRQRDESGGRTRMWRVFTCHKFSSDRAGSIKALRHICRALVQEGCLPLSPQLVFPQYIDEDRERDLAMRLCQELIRTSDELRVFGSELTPGMRVEISYAELLGIPVRYVSTAAEVP